eukprot:CAMPEP_0118863774 /NCGR_PEP_ID=MMETSP1163-20130328/8530_1 /TAXON_ID=124430 /ORGANISM="Phaeomonas parva, Strain CCMP2877" /LENGTH=184 /DNA_ID=CAMNT_0006797807 /DNA_START=65 /DNA_END=616 /DNA_ORIENTATION=+
MTRRQLALGMLLLGTSATALQLPGLGSLGAAPAKGPLAGVRVSRVGGGEVDLGAELGQGATKKLLVLGTYAADFNAIEYGQKVSHYLPELEAKGVDRVLLVLNAEPEACKAFAEYLDLPAKVELLSDPEGTAGRAFGVSRGWLPDNEDVSPYLKLFGMLWGLGAGGTLPSVIAGYVGNPWGESA